jgi:GT2 family glycosyltransferase
MLTSIILLTLNNLACTVRCIQNIRKYTNVPYEIIAVDNGSTDGTASWLAVQPDVRLIANPVNRGFAAGCNQGAEAAAGEFILLLNNDTVVSSRWLSQLLAALRESEQVGAAGPKSNRVLPMQHVAVTLHSEEEIHRFSDAFNRSAPSKWSEVSCLSGFCILVRRKTWKQLGGMDESYRIGGMEDVDFSYRLLKAGLSLRVAGDTFVYHEGSSSFTANAIDIWEAAAEGRRIFLRKWGFNPDRLTSGTDPAFLPGRYAAPHPHHPPAGPTWPDGWYAQDEYGRIYRIEQQRKRPLASIGTLHALNVGPARIAPVSSAFLRHFPDGLPLDAASFPHGYPNVFLARDPAGGMYVISCGICYPIANEKAFAAMGFQFHEAVSLPYQAIRAFQSGWPVRENAWEEHELVDYRLYLGPDGKLYYSEGQRLREVPGEAALRRYGLHGLAPVPLPPGVFVRLSKGFPLPVE